MSKRPSLKAATSVAGAVIALGVLTSVHRWLPHTTIVNLLAPTPESALAATLVWTLTLLPRARARLVHWPIAVLLAAVVLFGVGEGFYRSIFRHGFVPWTDLAYFPALMNMVFSTEAFSSPILLALPLVAIAAGATVGVRALLGWLDAALRAVTWRVPVALCVAMVGLGAAVLAGGYQTPISLLCARQLPRPVAEESLDAIARVDRDRSGSAQTDVVYSLPGIKDRDIHLMIVESYGHTLFSNPEHRGLMAPVYDELQQMLTRAGLSVYSTFLESPAFGGRSWLADATILTGIFVDTQYTYDALIESAGRNLTHLLGEAGYYRVLAAPGTYEADEAWRAFYQFDRYLFRHDFGYAGPFIGFGAMPDQYLLQRTWELTRDQSSPLFVNYVMVSSHVPFDRLPVYLEDWTRLGDGSIFTELPIRTFENNWLHGEEYPQGYVASIEYSLRSALTFVADRLNDGSLVIIVGDHQPRVPVSEPDSTFSVPIHVISSDQELARPFLRFGFRPGLAVTQAPPHRGMDSLLAMLLQVADGRAEMPAGLEP